MSNAFDRLLVPRLALAALGLGVLVGTAVSASRGMKMGAIAAVFTWALAGGIETTVFILLDKAERRDERRARPTQSQDNMKKISANHGLESTGAPPAAGTPETHP